MMRSRDSIARQVTWPVVLKMQKVPPDGRPPSPVAAPADAGDGGDGGGGDLADEWLDHEYMQSHELSLVCKILQVTASAPRRPPPLTHLPLPLRVISAPSPVAFRAQRRLLARLRFRECAVYSVHVSLDWSVHYCPAPHEPLRGTLHVNFACEPKGADALVRSVVAELVLLREEGPTDEDVEAAVEMSVREHEEAVQVVHIRAHLSVATALSSACT